MELRLEPEERKGLQGVSITRYQQGKRNRVDDIVAREVPLEVRLNGRTLVHLMRLPGDEVLLAVGFCFSEGLINSREQVECIHYRGEAYPGSLETLFPQADGRPGSGDRDSSNLVDIKASTDTGIERYDARLVRTGCGAADLSREIDLSDIHVESNTRFPPGVIENAPGLLLEGQEVFQATGGTHGAGLFGPGGQSLITREDVGRHNAVDKVLGYLLLSGERVDDKGLMLSGRLSYEMVLKGARAGIPLICSISAPTALGVDVGVKTGVTLVGFLRGSSFNVYTHSERIGGS